MPYQPTYPYPYMDTIDVEKSEGNNFKCLINSKDTILGATLNIRKNSSQSDVLISNGSTVSDDSSTENISTVYIDYDEELYNNLKERLNNNENLTLRIMSECRKIKSVGRRARLGGSPPYHYIMFSFTENFNSTSAGRNYQYYIYTDVVKRISLSEDLFPCTDKLGDESWLTCNIDNNGLYNGTDYKWSLNMKFQNYETLFTGYVSYVSSNSAQVYLLYDENIYNLLKNKIENEHDCKIIVNSSEESDIRSVINDTINNIMYMRVDTSLTSPVSVGDWVEIYTETTDLTTPEYYFKARTTPEIVFDVPETISNGVHTFKATYSQKQKVGVAYFQYDLYADGELIDSSGQVFSQDISYIFESLVNGKNYLIKLIVVNDDKIELEEERGFAVKYELFAPVIDPMISVDNFKTCINVDFSNNASIPSTLIGSPDVKYEIFGNPEYKIISTGNLISYTSPTDIIIQPCETLMVGMYLKIGNELRQIVDKTRIDAENVSVTLDEDFTTTPEVGVKYEICSYYNGIRLNKDQAILWDNISGNPLVLPNKSTQVVHWHASRGFNGLILEKTNSEKPEESLLIFYSGGVFTYKIGALSEVSYNPYVGIASAIAGRDEYSTTGVVQDYSSSTLSIILENSPLIEVGKCIQIGTESRTIESIAIGETTTEAVLDRTFTIDPVALIDSYVIYDENYLYTLSDSDELFDTDILIDNDLAYKYWWLIVILPDKVQFIKTTSFIESEV